MSRTEKLRLKDFYKGTTLADVSRLGFRRAAIDDPGKTLILAFPIPELASVDLDIVDGWSRLFVTQAGQ